MVRLKNLIMGGLKIMLIVKNKVKFKAKAKDKDKLTAKAKIKDIFNQLEGTWEFSRNLIDNRAGNLPKDFLGMGIDIFKGRAKISSNFIGIVEGRAKIGSLRDNPNEMHYVEEGKFIMYNGKIFNIQKEYIYYYDEQKYQITKYFALHYKKIDVFYKLHFTDHVINSSNINVSINEINLIKATGMHTCKNDHYVASYEFSKDRFNLTYVVNGPNKNYTSETRFIRD